MNIAISFSQKVNSDYLKKWNLTLLPSLDCSVVKFQVLIPLLC